MNLLNLTAEQLVVHTKLIVTREREITAQLISHLSEINRRLLFLQLGYSSLFEFSTKELGLSEGSAYRRIQAMRLVTDVPEAKQAFEEGSLSLSNAAKLQTYFHAQKKAGKPKNLAEKKEIAMGALNQSQSQCEKRLFELSPELPTTDRARLVSPEHRELKFAISEALFQKINRLKELLAHSHPAATYAELLEFLVNGMLEKLERSKGLRQKSKIPDSSPNEPPSTACGNVFDKPPAEVLNQVPAVLPNPENASPDKIQDQNPSICTLERVLPVGVRVALPAHLKREVWGNARGRCQYSYRGRRCSSRYRLEIDHAQPLALNGSNDLSNLRLLCSLHHSLVGIQIFGAEKREAHKLAIS